MYDDAQNFCLEIDFVDKNKITSIPNTIFMMANMTVLDLGVYNDVIRYVEVFHLLTKPLLTFCFYTNDACTDVLIFFKAKTKSDQFRVR